MAHYVVRAKPVGDRLDELRARLDADEIVVMRPFGRALDHSLRNARREPGGWAVWEEEDYCSPPLAMERAAVLDVYFTDLSVDAVAPGEGWKSLETLPGLWGD
jgi:hypothetical protein